MVATEAWGKRLAGREKPKRNVLQQHDAETGSHERTASWPHARLAVNGTRTAVHNQKEWRYVPTMKTQRGVNKGQNFPGMGSAKRFFASWGAELRPTNENVLVVYLCRGGRRKSQEE